MLSNPAPFAPITTVSIVPTTTSQAIALSAQGSKAREVRIANSFSSPIYVEFGADAASVTAVTTTSMQMLPNSVEVFRLDTAKLAVAVVAEFAGVGRVSISSGLGV